MINFEKRKKIMGRSIALGHCICNPKDPCPCPLFKQKNVCLCAGEREADAAEDVPLTQFVENAGCASKIGQDDLKKALAGLPRSTDPNVLVSADTCDDAGVYKLDDEHALVQTVDVFTPVGRRPLSLRPDRRRQFRQRRLRHGRPPAHRPLDRRPSPSSASPTAF